MACQPVCPPHARRSTCECDSCTFSSPETHAVTRHLPETTAETLSEFTAVICYIATLYMVACPLATYCVAVVCAAHWRVFAAIRVCYIALDRDVTATGSFGTSDPRADRTRSRNPSFKIENVPARSGVEAALARGSRACRSSELELLEQGGGPPVTKTWRCGRGAPVRAAPCPSPVRREAPGPGTRSRDPDLNRPSQLPYTGYTLARYDIAIRRKDVGVCACGLPSCRACRLPLPAAPLGSRTALRPDGVHWQRVRLL